MLGGGVPTVGATGATGPSAGGGALAKSEPRQVHTLKKISREQQ